MRCNKRNENNSDNKQRLSEYHVAHSNRRSAHSNRRNERNNDNKHRASE